MSAQDTLKRIKALKARVEKLLEQNFAKSNTVEFGEAALVLAKASSRIGQYLRDLEFSEFSLENGIKYEKESEDDANRLVETEKKAISLEKKIKAIETVAIKAISEVDEISKNPKKKSDPEEEENPKPAAKPKPPKFTDIPKRIDEAVTQFNKSIPGIQRGMFDALMEEVSKLDLQPNGNIKATVANIKRIAAIKNKLNRLILTDEYRAEVKEFAKAFNDVTRLQNEYWRSVERTFRPRPLLKEIRRQAIGDVVKNLMETGIDANVSTPLAEILRRNITTGGSIKELTGQMRQSVIDVLLN